MGQSAADAVEAAMEALCTADAEAAAAVAQGDGRINNMERDIEHRCMTLLLRQQPVAGDLRRISTTMKAVSYTHLDVYKRQSGGRATLITPRLSSSFSSTCSGFVAPAGITIL